MHPRHRPNLIRTASAVVALGALLWLGRVAPAARQDIPVRWQGEIVVAYDHPAPSGSTGRYTTTWRLRPRWEERRIDVTDARGRVTGQLVLLADDGSTWTAASTGRWVGDEIRTTFLGEGAGEGSLTQGLVYFSLVDDDPLAEVLPDRSYRLFGRPVEQFTIAITAETPFGKARNRTDTRLTYHIGHIGWGVPFDFPRDSIAAADIATAIGMEIRGDVGGSDNELRVLDEDGAMVGEYMWPREGSPIMTWHVRWDVARRMAIDTRLDPVDPGWRPKLANGVTVEASVDPSLDLEGTFRFTLFDVSREPGYALNAGGSGTGLDLRFASDQAIGFEPPVETRDGWQIETTDTRQAAPVAITAMDYGASGKLRAHINVEGTWQPVDTADGKGYITIPLDEDENRIWDTWERNTGIAGQAPDADQDPDPTGPGNGDGFSNYEEYRGFEVEGTWVSLDPRTKELFVVDEVGYGIGDFVNSSLLTYILAPDEIGSDRVVNINANHATNGPQRALRLVNRALPPGTLGRVSPVVGTPNQVTEAAVDMAQLLTPAAIDTTIAHELGHGVGLHHHGDYEEGSCNGGTRGLIALWNGAHGGDRTCVMSYGEADYYRGWDGVCYDFVFPKVWGQFFCTSTAGTDINAGARRMEDGRPLPVSGPGLRGGCRHEIRLK